MRFRLSKGQVVPTQSKHCPGFPIRLLTLFHPVHGQGQLRGPDQHDGRQPEGEGRRGGEGEWGKELE